MQWVSCYQASFILFALCVIYSNETTSASSEGVRGYYVLMARLHDRFYVHMSVSHSKGQRAFHENNTMDVPRLRAESRRVGKDG